MKKSVLLFSFIFIMFYFDLASAALGISPAIKEINFVPNGKYEFIYYIIADRPDMELEIYASGDLAEYVTLSKKENKGAGSFTVTINFPAEVEIPGPHEISIGIREKIDETSLLGTAIDIRGAIKVFVPYPGKYVELKLNVAEVNVDQLALVEVTIINRGSERTSTLLNINFLGEDGEALHKMSFSPVQLSSAESATLRRALNTSILGAGDYVAEAIAIYDTKETRINQSFRVGHLFIDITNYTQVLLQEGISKFFIDIESRWNGRLENVYADVGISNSSYNFAFRTPPVSLTSWGRDTLTGYLDTAALEGIYTSNITLNYAKQKTEVISSLKVIKPKVKSNVMLISILILAAIILIILIIFIFRKKIKKLFHKK